MTFRIALALMFINLFTLVKGQVFDAVVAQDGSGTHTTIERALISRSVKLIYIKNGVYEEKLRISVNGVRIVGENPDSVIIRGDDHANDGLHNTGTSYTVLIEGDDILLENLTIENVAGNVGQAVALHTKGQQIALKNCRLTGFQDTYYVDGAGMVFNQNVYVEGATDFIFGDATAVFQNCQIVCVKGGQYITAPADPKLITTVDGAPFYHGTLFRECDIIAGDGVSANAYFLGRPWQHNSSSVYINCVYEDHIKPEGWSEWNDNTHLSAVFAEYQPKDPSGNLIDTTQRVDWSIQLTKDQVDNYYNLDYFLNGWDPLPVVADIAAPVNVTQDLLAADSIHFMMTWDAVDGAIGYEISSNGNTVGFSTETSYQDDIAGNYDLYTVRAVSANGNLSPYSEAIQPDVIVTGFNNIISEMLKITNTSIEIDKPGDMRIVSLSGRVIQVYNHVRSIDINTLKKGVYILQLTNDEGQYHARKFIKN